jgi:DNA (cytosine-5)-methyltransferase 1
LRVLDLFSGIGGFSIGLERAGMRTVAFCEIDRWCQRLLKTRFPGVPVLEDVRTADFPAADIICGGFPCQDVSLAGKRAGVAGERSGLYREVLRAIRMVRPKFTLLENVAALLGNGMGTVLGDVAEDGLDAEWDCVSAGDLGAPHGRDRVWIALADADKLERTQRGPASAGWWLWSAEEVAAARDTNGDWQLEPPRLLGNVRRWVDDAASGGTWWADNWEEKFEAFRRMDDGIPTRLDRSAVASAIKPLGNTVVPQIPEIWGRAIVAAVSHS